MHYTRLLDGLCAIHLLLARKQGSLLDRGNVNVGEADQ